MNRPELCYSMLINWSDVDQCYIVCIPEFGHSAKTHGKTWEEAVAMGKDLMESCIGWQQDEGKPLPEPLTFDDDGNYAPNPFKHAELVAEIERMREFSAEYGDDPRRAIEPAKEAAGV